MTILAFATAQAKSVGGPSMETWGVWFLFLLILLFFYFLPAVIASNRNTKHGGMIVFINFVFGWTVLGWIAALIWAIDVSKKVARLE
jgi:Superinfection immunity protein